MEKTMKKMIAPLLLILAAATMAAGEDMDPANCPLHEQHMKEAAKKAAAETVVPNGDAQHGAGVDARHDTLVASHQTTRHSFRLFADGGAIELRAVDPADQATVDAVRIHLQDIAAQFAKNDFSTPAFVHGRRPAGVAAMQRLHDSIQFRYEDRDGGGRIHITTADSAALAAIHEFLKFQVIEHRTANSGVVEKDQ
jgi:hypothetical protein